MPALPDDRRRRLLAATPLGRFILEQEDAAFAKLPASAWTPYQIKRGKNPRTVWKSPSGSIRETPPEGVAPGAGLADPGQAATGPGPVGAGPKGQGKKPLLVENLQAGQPHEQDNAYHAEVTPGEKVRIFGRYRSGRATTAWKPMVPWVDDYGFMGLWLDRLGDREQREIGSLLARARGKQPGGMERPDHLANAVAGDWIEEHGGRRNWADKFIVYIADSEPVYQDFDRTFKLGDVVWTPDAGDVGRITAIGTKTVTVGGNPGLDRKPARLSLFKFAATNARGAPVAMSAAGVP